MLHARARGHAPVQTHRNQPTHPDTPESKGSTGNPPPQKKLWDLLLLFFLSFSAAVGGKSPISGTFACLCQSQRGYFTGKSEGLFQTRNPAPATEALRLAFSVYVFMLRRFRFIPCQRKARGEGGELDQAGFLAGKSRYANLALMILQYLSFFFQHTHTHALFLFSLLPPPPFLVGLFLIALKVAG